MLHSACCCQCQKTLSLKYCSASKAGLSLHPSCGLGRKAHDCLARDIQIPKRRSAIRSHSPRHVVTFASADLQTTFQPFVTRDVTATVLAVVGAYVWVRLFDWLATKGVLEQTLSRKLVHITSGPLFVLTWPLFSAGSNARYFAAVVPLLNALRLALVGTGLVKSEGTVKAVSRGGDRQELLRGPLFYVLIMTAVTVVFWRESPVGMMVLSLMCGGDGLADIIGRKYGTVKLPFNKAKSWAGSLAMFTGGAVMSLAFIALYNALGYFPYGVQILLPTVLSTSLVACAVESLPINQIIDDNFSVPAITAIMGHFLLQAVEKSSGLL
ncbi:hypothetical protein ABBQ32_011165 [Trebouxia sp. C0010 RCD-2024]